MYIIIQLLKIVKGKTDFSGILILAVRRNFKGAGYFLQFCPPPSHLSPPGVVCFTFNFSIILLNESRGSREAVREFLIVNC